MEENAPFAVLLLAIVVVCNLAMFKWGYAQGQQLMNSLECTQQGQIVSKSYTTDSKGDRVELVRVSQGCIMYKVKGAE